MGGHRYRIRRRLLTALLPLALTGCAAGPGGGATGQVAGNASSVIGNAPSAIGNVPSVTGTAPSVTGGSTAEPGATASSTASCAEQIAGTLDARAKAGQLLVVGSALPDPIGAGLDLVHRIGPAGVLLAGRSRSGVDAVAQRTSRLQRAATAADDRIGMLVAADQEGGQVQALSGPGFSTIPTAAEQGSWSAAKLTGAATRWGGELKAAGVNLDLAPVTDVLSPALGSRNTSVGVSRRAYGTEPDAVRGSVLAFLAGLRNAGIATSVKHFPGLGQVAGNTDFSADVRDTTTGPDSASLGPFRAAVDAGVPLVMVSSAVYSRIDSSSPAAFSEPVIGGLLRGRLGFTGVVVSDDLGRAVAVASVPPGGRAVRFVAAGGDLVLTVDPQTAEPMLDGLVDRMAVDPGFAAQVDAAVRRVLAAKAALGLLRC